MAFIRLTPDFYYCGVADPGLKTFDIIMETKYGTSYNAYLLKTGEKAVLFETAKEEFQKEYLENIAQLTDFADIEAVVISHTEPDHLGSLGALLQKNPNIKVIGSTGAIQFAGQILNRPFLSQTVQDGQEITIGDKTLQFFLLPNLHWPDTMYTWISNEKALITCDSFGAHYCSGSVLRSEVANETEYLDAAKYYYECILSPFSVPFMQKGIETAVRLQPALICPGHGPVLDSCISQTLEIYRLWAAPKRIPGVVIAYVSAYGYTRKLALAMAEGLSQAGVNARLYDAEKESAEVIAADIAAADGFLLGSSTIVGDAVAPIWALTAHLHWPQMKDKTAAAFGSYGWSGEAVPNLTARLTQLRCNVKEGFRIRFRPSADELKAATEFGRSFGEGLKK